VAEHYLAMDVWEHAYYLTIKTEDQITSKLFSVINWTEVARRFALENKSNPPEGINKTGYKRFIHLFIACFFSNKMYHVLHFVLFFYLDFYSNKKVDFFHLFFKSTINLTY
jgi:hypothetical protein